MKLYLGDCLEVMKEIKDKSIDLILCDLPYSITKCKWDKIIPFDKLWEQYHRIIKDNGAIVLFGQEPFSSHLRLSSKYYKYDWIWKKNKKTGFLNANKQPLRNYENIHVFYKNQCTYNPQKTVGHKKKVSYRKKQKENVYGEVNSNYYESTERFPTSILEFDVERGLHPTQKPIALLEYLIKTYTNEGETVLDNTMGSGSTGVACLNTNRQFIGIEKEEKYFNIAKDRLEKCQQMR